MGNTEENIDILSKTECQDIIRNYFGIKLDLIAYRISYATESIGFLGDYLSLKLLVQNVNGKNEESCFFVKSVPRKDIQQLKLIEELGVFEKELSLYGELFVKLKEYSSYKWHPEKYYLRADIIVMEDLLKAGYKHLPENFALTLNHIKIVLDCIAKMHANSIAFEVKSKERIVDICPRLLHEFSICPEEGWLKAGLMGIQAVAKRHPKFQTDEYRNFIENKLLEALNPVFNIVKLSDRYQSVLTHRDTWGKNIFYKFNEDKFESPVECILVDFQASGYHPPAFDVLMFIFLNAKRSFRDKHMTECLEYYYQKLSESLHENNIQIENYLSRNEFNESCEFVKLVPLVLNAIYTPTTFLSREFNILKKDDPEKFYYHVRVNRNDLILNKLENDSNFKSCIFDIVEELVDYVFFLKESNSKYLV